MLKVAAAEIDDLAKRLEFLALTKDDARRLRFTKGLRMSITLTEVRAVRIVCDERLKTRLFEHITRVGATGYSWWQAHGKGEHPTDTGFLSELRRVYIEVWCNPEVAEKILTYCDSSQFHDIGMAAGITSLSVFEDDAGKFTKR